MATKKTTKGDAKEVLLFAKEAEQSIVAALFSVDAKEAYDRLVLTLKPEDFFFPHYRLVFDAFASLIEKNVPPDATSLATRIKSSEGYDDTVRDVVGDAVSQPYSLENIEVYAKAVVEKSRARKLSVHLHDLREKTSLVGGDLSSKELLREIDAIGMQFDVLENQNQLLELPSDLMVKMIERLDKIQSGDVVGVKTGIEKLDEKLGGFMPGHLVVIAGRPGMGKTLLAGGIGINHGVRYAPENEEPPVVAFFSLEMGPEQLGFRLVSNLGTIDHDKLRKAQLEEQDWSKLTYALKKFESSSFHVDCDPVLTPSILRSKLRLLQRKVKRKIGLVIVDYLQLMQGDGTGRGGYPNRNEEVSDISKYLKRIAKEFDAPVIALSQLNRGVESRADKRPLMSDLRESGAVEQDADIILMLYRDEYYNPDSDAKGIVEIIAAKARDGGDGVYPAMFVGEYQKIEDLKHSNYSYESKYKD